LRFHPATRSNLLEIIQKNQVNTQGITVMKTYAIPVLLVSASLIAGCGTTTTSRTASGAAGGAAAGALIGSTSANAGKGALIGAGVGALGGYVYDQNEKEKEREARRQQEVRYR
jgi:uncharacterized membrane protein YebE (DUF533 family)